MIYLISFILFFAYIDCRIIVKPNNNVVIEGDTAIIHCITDSEYPIIWRFTNKDEIEYNDFNKILYNNHNNKKDYSIIIKNVTSENHGKYDCFENVRILYKNGCSNKYKDIKENYKYIYDDSSSGFLFMIKSNLDCSRSKFNNKKYVYTCTISFISGYIGLLYKWNYLIDGVFNSSHTYDKSTSIITSTFMLESDDKIKFNIMLYYEGYSMASQTLVWKSHEWNDCICLDSLLKSSYISNCVLNNIIHKYDLECKKE